MKVLSNSTVPVWFRADSDCNTIGIYCPYWLSVIVLLPCWLGIRLNMRFQIKRHKTLGKTLHVVSDSRVSV